MPLTIKPFTIDIPEADLDDLHERLARTRFSEQLPDAGWDYGTERGYLQELVAYWRDDYDWRRAEARLNSFQHFLTEIDGTRVHFLHARSPEPDAFPLVVTHGWPGSIVEFLDVIGPLTDPRAHGGDPADAFHVVAPSLPGYGWSDKPDRAGWGVPRIATAWDELMHTLGYERYGAQGGDWGASVTSTMGAQAPDGLVGVHVNMAIAFPKSEDMTDLTATEQQALADVGEHMKQGTGYSTQQSTRPQTLGYGLTDSPSGQCAWIAEKFWAWTDCDGH